MTNITVKTAIAEHRNGNTPEALRQFRLLATPEDSHACYALGYFLIEVLKEPSFYEEGWASINNASKAGNGDAKEFIAWHKLYGTILKKEPQEALKIFKSLADEGSVSAMANIGFAYSSDDFGLKDLKIATEWYEKAANLGDSESQFQLAILQLSEKSVYDISKAIQNLFYLTQNGNADAAYELGRVYYTGNGVDEDNERAIEYFQIAYDLGSMEAAGELGFIYLTGDHVQKNEVKGIELIMQAAESGNALAQYQLGSCYEYGEGCEESVEHAEFWYQKAAEQGNAAAMRNLGSLKCNWFNSIIDPSYLQYTIKAAKMGDVLALKHLGCHHLEGRVVPQSNLKAMALFMLGETLSDATPVIQQDLKSRKEMLAEKISEKERADIEKKVAYAANLHSKNTEWLNSILKD